MIYTSQCAFPFLDRSWGVSNNVQCDWWQERRYSWCPRLQNQCWVNTASSYSFSNSWLWLFCLFSKMPKKSNSADNSIWNCIIKGASMENHMLSSNCVLDGRSFSTASVYPRFSPKMVCSSTMPVTLSPCWFTPGVWRKMCTPAFRLRMDDVWPKCVRWPVKQSYTKEGWN